MRTFGVLATASMFTLFACSAAVENGGEEGEPGVAVASELVSDCYVEGLSVADSQSYGSHGPGHGDVRPIDWSKGNFKGECKDGYAVAGVSTANERRYEGYLGMSWVQRLLCCKSPAGNPALYDQAANTGYCRSVPLGSNLLASRGWDWDPGYIKTEADPDAFLAGVSQVGSGFGVGAANRYGEDLRQVLSCFNGQGRTRGIEAQRCGVQLMYAGTHQQNSPAFAGHADWNEGYYKGQCPDGQYVGGISSFASGLRTGNVHALLCCSP
jgi:hypothetical protein